MTSDPFSLAGKVAVVTGANTGIGQGIAVAFANAGADIVAVGRTPPTDTADAVEEAGRSCHFVHADLSSTAPIPQIIRGSLAEFGRIDILVNNAGIIRRTEALEFTERDWDDVLDTNLKTPFFLAQAAAKQMLKQGDGGSIINIASLLSFQGGIRIASYTASKSGIAGLTRLLACEWAAKGVNVNAIAPGYFITHNTEALRTDESRSREILARIPVGRWGMPADIGGAAVFLASAAARYVHGVVLPVDGGWLAR